MKNKRLTDKEKTFSIFQITTGASTTIGILILVWSGIKMAPVFPYTIHIGAALVVGSLLLILVTDKSKWSGKRSDYPNDLGGSNGGGG